MAKITIKGAEQAKRNMDKFIDDVVNVRAVRAVQSALMIFGAEAAAITPVDTSTLINSMYRDVVVNGMMVTGRVGYSANYALYVHQASGKLKGQRRPKGRGVYWGPSGQPQFLNVGIQRGMPDAEAVIIKEMSK